MTDLSKNEKIDSRFVNNGTPNSSNCTKDSVTICLFDGGDCPYEGKCSQNNCKYYPKD